MSLIKRHFFQSIIAPKYISTRNEPKLFQVFFSCYEFTTNLLGVRTRSNLLFSDSKGDSFIDNYLYRNDLPFYYSKNRVNNSNICIDKHTL